MTTKVENLLFAVGTDDKITYSKEHFGSSTYFLIYSYDIESKKIKLVKELENTSPEEQRHGDPKKARNITKLLDGISFILARRMGLNVSRIRRLFVPVRSTEPTIDHSFLKLPNLIPEILNELKKPAREPKKILKL